MARALFALGIFVILTSVFLINQKPSETQAASVHKIRGWGWSENTGWISMNCYNDYAKCVGGTEPGTACSQDADCSGGGVCEIDGVFENCCPGGNPADCPYGLAGGDYGVHYDKEGDRTLSGWAWSENVGWICFGKTCQNVCLGGSNNGAYCTLNANCPGGVCGGQPPHGLPVSWACVGNPGWLCQGGTEPGTLCFNDTDCEGGGLCRFSCAGDNGENFIDTAPCVRSSHLKAYWKMNSIVAGAIADDSGNGNADTLMPVSTPPNQVQGKFGNALQFDGVEDYIEAADSASLSVTGNLTVETWVKRGEINREQTIIAKWDELLNKKSYRLWFDVNNRLNFTVSDGTNIATVTQKDGICLGLNAETTQCLTDNDCAPGEACKHAPITDTKKWHHIAGKYVADDVGTNINEKNLRIFIDGSRIPTYAVAGTIPNSLTDQSEKLYIGAKKGASSVNTYFKGTIDNVSVWSCQNVGKILGRNDKEIWDDAKIELDGWARVISLGDRGWLKLGGFTKDGRVWGSSLHDYTTFYTFNGYLANRWVDESVDTSGLVAYWKMNEPSWSMNTQVNDDSGNGNHGVAYGGATTTDEGLFNRASDFDGSNDYVNIIDSTSLDSITNNITISLWVNPSSTQATYADIIDRHNCTNMAWTVQQQSTTTNKYYFGVYIAGAWYCNNDAGATQLTANTWQHFVVQRVNDKIYHYLNGNLVLTCNAAAGTIGASASPLKIGYGCSTRYFNGFIDNVAIYNRALEPEEISEIYNKRIPHCVGWDEYDHEYEEPPAPLAFDSLTIDNTQGCAQLSVQWALAPWAESYTYERCDNASDDDCGTCSYTQRSVLADSCDETGCSLSDTGLTPNAGYCYKIQAHNETGSTWATNNPPTYPMPYWKSTTLCSPEGVASNTDTCGQIVVKWTKGDDVDGYNIYRSLTGSGSKSCEELIYAGCELTGHLAEALDYDANNDATNDLVAQWKMNEASWSGESGEVHDSSAQTPLNNGTAKCVGTCTVPTTAVGKFDKAGLFDGIDDYIDCGKNASLDLGLSGDSFTLESWIKPNNPSPSAYGAVIAKDSYTINSDRNYWFGQKISSSGIYFGTRNQADNNYASWITNTGLTIDSWNHIAVVWDRTGNNVILYINGKTKNWDTSGGTPFNIPSAYDTNVNIGMSGDINLFPFSGLIDNVAIYNVAKTAEQIKIDYEAGVKPNCESGQCGLSYVCDDATLPHNKCGAANTCCYTDSRIIPYINYYYRVTGTGVNGETPASTTVGPNRTVCFPPSEEEEEQSRLLRLEFLISNV